jgi:predicted metal-binding membrane protein
LASARRKPARIEGGLVPAGSPSGGAVAMRQASQTMYAAASAAMVGAAPGRASITPVSPLATRAITVTTPAMMPTM